MKVPFLKRSSGEQGYILLTLMLFVALLTIGLLAMVQNVELQIRRDREEELIHRGVQYSRAIGKFVRKFGRYPQSVDELESTNNIRFLRKRYKDPITGKDFKLLSLDDVYFLSQAKLGAAAGPAPPPPAPAPAADTPAAAPARADAAPVAGSDGSTQPGDPNDPNQADESPAVDNSPIDGPLVDPNEAVQPEAPDPGAARAAVGKTGGSIVGVASFSNAKSIREFGHYDHYNQWQFVFDPATKISLGRLNAPYQPVQRTTDVNGDGSGQSGQ